LNFSAVTSTGRADHQQSKSLPRAARRAVEKLSG
jgi:hypothetical protein